MSRWLVVLGVVVLALLGVLYWKMSTSPEQPQPQVAEGSDQTDKGGKVPPAPTPDARAQYVVKHPDRDSAGRDGGSGEVALLDPESEAFHRRVDVVVGDRLRESAAFDCDESALDPDAEIKLNYRLRIVNGRITVSDVRVMHSDVSKAYEECYIRKVSAATFRMEDMPDFEEGDQELFTRVRSMKKYRSRAEFDKD